MTYQTNLPFVTGSPKPTAPVYDMYPLLSGDGRLYEMTMTKYNELDEAGQPRQSTQRHQTQYESWVAGSPYRAQWYHTKTNGDTAEWEEFYTFGPLIFRGTDTSMGNGKAYSLMDHPPYHWSKWCPRFWTVGDIYERAPYVEVRRKDNCELVPAESGGPVHTWLRFAWYAKDYDTAAGLLHDVVQLDWITRLATEYEPEQVAERYIYGGGLGLIEWIGSLGRSEVTEIHAKGARPDNVMEECKCWDGGYAK